MRRFKQLFLLLVLAVLLPLLCVMWFFNFFVKQASLDRSYNKQRQDCLHDFLERWASLMLRTVSKIYFAFIIFSKWASLDWNWNESSLKLWLSFKAFFHRNFPSPLFSPRGWVRALDLRNSCRLPYQLCYCRCPTSGNLTKFKNLNNPTQMTEKEVLKFIKNLSR